MLNAHKNPFFSFKMMYLRGNLTYLSTSKVLIRNLKITLLMEHSVYVHILN